MSELLINSIHYKGKDIKTEEYTINRIDIEVWVGINKSDLVINVEFEYEVTSYYVF